MTKSKLRRLLTKPKFRAWLEAKKPRTVVGVAGSITACPFARHLSGHLGEREFVEITESTIDVSDVDSALVSRITTPEWCKAVIEIVDHCGVSRITASRALRILDVIK